MTEGLASPSIFKNMSFATYLQNTQLHIYYMLAHSYIYMSSFPLMSLVESHALLISSTVLGVTGAV